MKLIKKVHSTMFTQRFFTKLLGLSTGLLIASLGHAHTNYSARYVMPDELQEWTIYNEEVHGEKSSQKVEDQLVFNPGYYFGFGLGSTHVAPEGSSNGFATDDDSSNGYKLYFGQHFKPNWAWEVSYADLGEAGLGNNINTTLNNLVPNAEIDYKVPAAWIKYLPLEPNENISVDLKAGLSFLSNSANDSRIGYTAQTSTQYVLPNDSMCVLITTATILMQLIQVYLLVCSQVGTMITNKRLQHL